MYKKEPIMPLLISHRMRGFDVTESSLEGLARALNSSFDGVEFDTRVSLDRTLFVNHDPDLHAFGGHRLLISNCDARELSNLVHPVTGKPIPTLREFLAIASAHQRNDFYICIDIKESGEETQIVALIKEFQLMERVIFFSWVPQALMTMHAILPEAPLYFSYYPVTGRIYLLALKARAQFIRLYGSLMRKPNRYAQLKSYFHGPFNSDIDDLSNSVGFETEYYSMRLPEGKFGEALRKSNGGVCVDYRLINNDFGRACRSAGFKLCCYGVRDNAMIKKIGSMQPDIILTDDPDVTK